MSLQTKPHGGWLHDSLCDDRGTRVAALPMPWTGTLPHGTRSEMGADPTSRLFPDWPHPPPSQPRCVRSSTPPATGGLCWTAGRARDAAAAAHVSAAHNGGRSGCAPPPACKAICKRQWPAPAACAGRRRSAVSRACGGERARDAVSTTAPLPSTSSPPCGGSNALQAAAIRGGGQRGVEATPPRQWCQGVVPFMSRPARWRIHPPVQRFTHHACREGGRGGAGAGDSDVSQATTLQARAVAARLSLSLFLPPFPPLPARGAVHAPLSDTRASAHPYSRGRGWGRPMKARA